MNLSSKIPFRSFLITVALVAPAFAQTLTTFTNGTVANATEVNGNFTNLKTALTATDAKATTADTKATTAQTAVAAATAAAAAAQTTADAAAAAAAAAQTSVGTLSSQVTPLTNALSASAAGVLSTTSYLLGNSSNSCYRGTVAKFASAAGWQPNLFGTNGVFLEGGEGESGGFFANANTAVIWSPGDNQLLKIYDEDSLNTSTTTPPAPRAYLDNGGTWYALGYQPISDETWKTNIQPITGALDKVLGVSGYTYDLRAEKVFAGEMAQNKAFDAQGLQNKIGFVAQDLQKTMPELVTYSTEWNCLTVNYDGMVPVLVEAIKEQQRQITELRTQLEKLQAGRK